MHIVRISVLATICIFGYVARTTGEPPRTVQDAILAVRELIKADQDPRHQFLTDVYNGDEHHQPVNNLWEALAMEQRPINISEECLGGIMTVVTHLAKRKEWAIKG